MFWSSYHIHRITSYTHLSDTPSQQPSPYQHSAHRTSHQGTHVQDTAISGAPWRDLSRAQSPASRGPCAAARPCAPARSLRSTRDRRGRGCSLRARQCVRRHRWDAGGENASGSEIESGGNGCLRRDGWWWVSVETPILLHRRAGRPWARPYER